MNVLWQRERATVGEVVEALPAAPRPAYNTVLTILRILERKGYVTHEKEGRAFAWVPVLNRREARRGALSHVLTRFFDDSPELLVVNLLGHDDTRPDEVRRVRDLIRQHELDRRREKRR